MSGWRRAARRRAGCPRRCRRAACGCRSRRRPAARARTPRAASRGRRTAATTSISGRRREQLLDALADDQAVLAEHHADRHETAPTPGDPLRSPLDAGVVCTPVPSAGARPWPTGAGGRMLPVSCPRRSVLVEAPAPPATAAPLPVPRTRLVRQLAGADAPIALIVAPAGYGKTALIAEWAARDPRPFAWLTCPATTPRSGRAPLEAASAPPAAQVIVVDDARLTSPAVTQRLLTTACRLPRGQHARARLARAPARRARPPACAAPAAGARRRPTWR